MIPPSCEVDDEQFWRSGGGFRWCWPKFDIVHPADPHYGFMLNRYPHNIIGLVLHLGHRGVGVRWKCSP